MGAMQRYFNELESKEELNKSKKLNLLKEMDAFPVGKTAESITVIQIVNF